MPHEDKLLAVLIAGVDGHSQRCSALENAADPTCFFASLNDRFGPKQLVPIVGGLKNETLERTGGFLL